MFMKATSQRSGEDFNVAALGNVVKQLKTFCDHLQVCLDKGNPYTLHV